jgi:hypothetical protein
VAFGHHRPRADGFQEADLELECRHGEGQVSLGDRGVGHGEVDHAGEEAALADLAPRMAEGRHDLETVAAGAEP